MTYTAFLLQLLFAQLLGIELNDENFAVTPEVKKPSYVVTVNDANFEEKVGAEDCMFVKFYAPWCKHCQNIAPLWEEAASLAKERGLNIKFAEYDVTRKDAELRKDLGVASLPTLLIFHKTSGMSHKNIGAGVQEKSLEYLMEVAESHGNPPAKLLGTQEEIDAVLNGKDIAIIGFIKRQHSDSDLIYHSIASWGRDNYDWYLVEDPELCFKNWRGADIAAGYIDKDKRREGAVAVVTPNNDEKIQWYDTDMVNNQHVMQWVHNQAIQQVNQLTKDNAVRFRVSGKLVLCAFLGDGVDPASVMGELTKAAREFPQYIVVYTETEQWNEDIIEKLGYKLPSEGMETNLAIWGLKHWEMWFASDDTISHANIQTFVKDFKAGRAMRLMKSQNPPEVETEDGLTTVVGRTGDAWLASDKNILMFVHASWCGHCQKAMPVYKEFAKHVEKVDVVIAAYENTENTPMKAFQAHGYPSIFWSTPATRADPEKLQDGEGGVERSIEGWTNFLKGKIPEAFHMHTEL